MIRRVVTITCLLLVGALTSSSAYSDTPGDGLEVGVEKIRSGKLMEGREVLLQAISANPRDQGSVFRIDKISKLSEDRLVLGREQLQKMLADRPSMQTDLDGMDPILDWAARQFGGETAGAPMLWSATEPTEVDAEHYVPVNGNPGEIRIASQKMVGGEKQDREFEELWKSAVFELINCGHANSFLEIDRSMRRGELSKEAYVKRNFELEFATAQATRGFYIKYFLPILARQGKPSEPHGWYVSAPFWRTSDDCFAQFRNRRAYPWSRYGAAYDKAQASRDLERLLNMPPP